MEILIEKVSKAYNPGLFKKKVHAVRDLSLQVGRGEVFGLVGPNGAGKSSTIRMLLGLTRPDAGRILYRGKLFQGAEVLREIGYLPENPYLYDHLNLRELLDFSGKISGLDRALRKRRIDELLERVELTGFAGRPLRTFSKGMLQRAGICYALLHDPSLVILDEPMSGLDPLGRNMVFDIVKRLKEEGKTIFFCSHILSDVERLCDRIGILVSGRLVREFAEKDFEENSALPIHLVLGPLDNGQRTLLSENFGPIQDLKDGHLLSVAKEDLGRAVERIEEAGGVVCATRTDRVSLEDLFIQTVEENRS